MGQGGLRAGRQLGDGTGFGRLSVKDQRAEEVKPRGPHRLYQNCRCWMKAAADGT